MTSTEIRTRAVGGPGRPAGRRPVPADAVRVWRGFRSPSLALPDFFQRLGTVFVPATVQMQIAIGLDGYVPAVPAGLSGKPATVPDETAVLFWDSQQTYHDGFDTLAVRTYTLTHAAVYTPASRADFPVAFTGTVDADQPYHLSNAPADWMVGTVWHLLAERPSTTDPEAFLVDVSARLRARQQAGGFAGAIACAGHDYLAYWELRDQPPGAPPDGQPDATFHAVGPATGWRYVTAARQTTMEYGLWEPWPGLDISSGDCLNMQFRRRAES